MRIIPLGVNAAFSVGEYKQVIDLNVLNSLLTKFLGSNAFAEQDPINILYAAINSAKELMYKPKWQSNFLFEFKTKGKVKEDVYRLVLDFGGDVRHALAGIGLKLSDIDGWYCSHPHNDHVGGIEGIALSTFFNPFYTKEKKDWIGDRVIFDIANQFPDNVKPDLYAHKYVIEEIWKTAAPGLETLQGVRDVKLETYFNVIPMTDNFVYSVVDGNKTWKFYTIVSTHVVSGMKLMPSYGVMFESDDKKIYLPTDTIAMQPPQLETFYRRADVVYQDCETGIKSGVHAHLDELKKLSPDIKKKLYLYHYNQDPQIEEGEFKGILRAGDVHEY